MKNLKFYISIFLARFVRVCIKLFSKSSGTSLAGMIVLKFYPEFLKHCSKYILNEKISVTGTNGKTTTSGMLSQILIENKRHIIHNSMGANMLTGIANVFATTVLPGYRYDNCVLESDEAYLSKLYDYITLDYLIVTNLFRDQLDRYGELDTTAKKIQSAIDKNKNLTLLLNADDPLVANLGKENRKIYYGFEEIELFTKNKKSNEPSEVFNCVCGKKLQYSKTFYAQQGHYYCDCGYKRPVCNYMGYAKIYDEYIELKIKHNENITEYKLNTVGIYSAYNMLASISMALELGFNQEQIQYGLNNYKAMFGRAEKTKINGHDTIIQLIKNPTGASEVLKTVDLNSRILIAINDNFADGRDVSWLWDAEFELLKDTKNEIITSGLRADDMALRLKYAGVEKEKIKVIMDLNKAVKYVAKNCKNDEKITVLPTYTALLELKEKKGKI